MTWTESISLLFNVSKGYLTQAYITIIYNIGTGSDNSMLHAGYMVGRLDTSSQCVLSRCCPGPGGRGTYWIVLARMQLDPGGRVVVVRTGTYTPLLWCGA